MLYPVGMPLSDHERKLLAEMEAAFEQDDPRLVSTLTGKVRTKQASRVLAGVITLLFGMSVLFGGLVAKVVLVSLAGFLIALTGAFLMVTNFSLPGRGGKKNAKPRWSDRLENRWDRRNDQ